jgi:hypothetical protein
MYIRFTLLGTIILDKISNFLPVINAKSLTFLEQARDWKQIQKNLISKLAAIPL